VAIAVRVTYIWLARRGLPVGGDSRYYHEGANLLAKGKGFIDPYQYLDAGRSVPAADHPPLYIVYLAAFSLVGLTSATAHLFVSALAGVATVVVVGLVGREIGGTRLGLIAAALAAVYPNLWGYDGALESETVAQLAVALTLLAAYVWWRAPTRRNAALVGAGIALGSLARAELLFLVVLLAVPLALFKYELGRGERLRQLGVSVVATLAVIAPWCAYNISRFERPTLLSTGFGLALDSSACDAAFYGPFTGYWSRDCVLAAAARSGLPVDADRSVLEEAHRKDATTYLRDHLSRLPVVMLARVGRTTGLFQLRQQAALDSFLGGRERWFAWTAWWTYFAAAVLAIAGGVILRRRRVPVFPLASLPVLVVITTAVFFGLVRYRAIAEVSLVVLAAVAVDAAVQRVSASMASP
jgi:4-amino-4-deoxy-L-arabinose transferase-like glycosyltransferase